MTDKALLLVYTEPGDNLTEDAYHDWYESEHIPLRMALPEFHSCSRLIQTDGKRPTYGATYDLPDTAALQTEAYSHLMANRSDREKDVIQKMEFLDRRLYVLNEKAPVTVKQGYTAHSKGITVSIVSIDVDEETEEEFHKWYDEEHIPMLMKIPGWLRSRRYILFDEGTLGALKGSAGETKKSPRFMAMHEFETHGMWATANAWQSPICIFFWLVLKTMHWMERIANIWRSRYSTLRYNEANSKQSVYRMLALYQQQYHRNMTHNV